MVRATSTESRRRPTNAGGSGSRDRRQFLAGETRAPGRGEGAGTQQRLLVAPARWAIVPNLPGRPTGRPGHPISQEEATAIELNGHTLIPKPAERRSPSG